MTPEELRERAEELEMAGVWDAAIPLVRIAPDLARLCAELGEAAEFASGYMKAHGDMYREAAWLIDLRLALAKLAELEAPK